MEKKGTIEVLETRLKWSDGTVTSSNDPKPVYEFDSKNCEMELIFLDKDSNIIRLTD